MLIRVIGPTLAAAPFNVTGVLANPRLEVYSGNNAAPVLTNDDWGTQAGGAAQVTAIQQAATRAAAFTLPNNSALVGAMVDFQGFVIVLPDVAMTNGMEWWLGL